MFRFLGSTFLLFTVALIFCCPETILAEEKGKKKKRSSKVTVEGRIHFYGDRYILKENEKKPGKWFILLENPTLEKTIKNLDPTKLYEVKGKVYKFNRNNYLLPDKIKLSSEKKTKKKSKKKKTKSKKKKSKTKKERKKKKDNLL